MRSFNKRFPELFFFSYSTRTSKKKKTIIIIIIASEYGQQETKQPSFINYSPHMRKANRGLHIQKKDSLKTFVKKKKENCLEESKGRKKKICSSALSFVG